MAPSNLVPPAVPPLELQASARPNDGLKSARVSMHTPRACSHTPRHASTFEAGGPLPEPFLYSHSSGVYFNQRAPEPPASSSMDGTSQSRLPAAYAVLRKLIDPEDAAAMSSRLISGAPGVEPDVRTFNKSKATFRTHYPALMDGAVALKDAFGLYLSEGGFLDASELTAVEVHDVRCVRYSAGHECPWHREDPGTHFIVMVLMSDPLEDFEGGTLVVHAGECADDGDAMPIHLGQGDAIIMCAPRIDHAVQRVAAGERIVCIFELRLGGQADEA